MRPIKNNIYSGESKLTFGKHKEESLNSVIVNDPSYVRWLLDNIKNFHIDKSAKQLLDKQPIATYINRSFDRDDYDYFSWGFDEPF